MPNSIRGKTPPPPSKAPSLPASTAKAPANALVAGGTPRPAPPTPQALERSKDGFTASRPAASAPHAVQDSPEVFQRARTRQGLRLDTATRKLTVVPSASATQVLKDVPLRQGVPVSFQVQLRGRLTLEGAALDLRMNHPSPQDVKVTVTSPSGTRVTMSAHEGQRHSDNAYWMRMSGELKGEPSHGTWTLTVEDTGSSGKGVLKGWMVDGWGQWAPHTPLPLPPEPPLLQGDVAGPRAQPHPELWPPTSPRYKNPAPAAPSQGPEGVQLTIPGFPSELAPVRAESEAPTKRHPGFISAHGTQRFYTATNGARMPEKVTIPEGVTVTFTAVEGHAVRAPRGRSLEDVFYPLETVTGGTVVHDLSFSQGEWKLATPTAQLPKTLSELLSTAKPGDHLYVDACREGDKHLTMTLQPNGRVLYDGQGPDEDAYAVDPLFDLSPYQGW